MTGDPPKRFPSTVRASCPHCDTKQYFSLGGTLDPNTFALGRSPKCIECKRRIAFLVLYPSELNGSDRIEPERILMFGRAPPYLREFGLEDIQAKITGRFESGDFDGAITSCYTLVEKYLKMRIIQSGCQDFSSTEGDIKRLYKQLGNHLGLSVDSAISPETKPFLSSLVAMVGGLYELANKLGDRHHGVLTPERTIAKTAIEATKVLLEFIHACPNPSQSE